MSLTAQVAWRDRQFLPLKAMNFEVIACCSRKTEHLRPTI